ncbi:MAG: hypothetical protein GXY17_07985 [Clostridiaceae bacterium]|nr:hypothetical protein [Clostridiaceae bacterium]
MSTNVFCENNEEVSYIWQNSYDKSKKLCRFDLSFFAREGELYRRFDETHYERCYQIAEIVDMLASAGINDYAVYAALKYRKPSKDSDRLFFACKKSG